MNPSEEFRKHATECVQMANCFGDATNKQEWTAIATRWLRLAEWYDHRLSLADHLKQLRARKKVSHPSQHVEL